MIIRKIMIPLVMLFPAMAQCVPDQTEGTIHLEGDSVTFNTYYEGVDSGWMTSSFFCPGARIDNPGFCTSDLSAKDRVPELVRQGQVDILVWALGLNEVLAEGWSARYQMLWTDLLAQKVPAETCIVLVKPWVLPMNNAQRPLEQMNAIRAWMENFASTHDNVVLVDWKPLLEANPHFSSEDGVHIVPGTGGAQARDVMYHQGVNQCEEL